MSYLWASLLTLTEGSKMPLWILGYCWAALTVGPGFLLFALFKLLGWVQYIEWSPAEAPHAVLVQLRGPLAAWISKPRADGSFFYGHTVGACMFFYEYPNAQEVTHEGRHVAQQMVLGPFHVLIYLVSYGIGLLRTRSAQQAYHDCVLEKDARRFAGENW